MFWGLLWLGSLVASGVNDFVHNECETKYVAYTAYGGEQIYMVKGRYKVDSEWLISQYKYDEYGHPHQLLVGAKSGKLYRDLYDRQICEKEYSNWTSKNEAIKEGKYAYSKYSPEFDRELPTDVANDKPIAAIFHFRRPARKGDIHGYRKFYLSDEVYGELQNIVKKRYPPYPGQFNFNMMNKIKTGDWGVPITQDEYDFIKDKFCGSGYSCAYWIDDIELRNKLGTKEDPYHEKTMRIERERLNKMEKEIYETEAMIRKRYEGLRFYILGNYDNKMRVLNPEDYGGKQTLTFHHRKRFLTPENLYINYNKPEIIADVDKELYTFNESVTYYSEVTGKLIVNTYEEYDLGVSLDTINKTAFELYFEDVTEKYIQDKIKDQKLAIEIRYSKGEKD